ncbi:DUF2358 domain-containing protein [Alkalinema sp. FACHB-956]|uniref:DUF2358 domain-containing protein n=1 Tax=Alkalinema sp. FACHB-956 TaxID=2692768 RepID=UPI001689901D|nr:DUF2358 domain-containing protein [Alkalinema sp. FACHB-956]MBD2327660.1 DUF2358 domain-containing protein [Alkalinema sp. FACHB-956]
MDEAQLDLLQVLREDYDRFPNDQTYGIYAADVFFKDPMNQFRGIDRYRQMIGFIQQWFRDVRLDLHQITQDGPHIRTDWTLHWTTPLPWQPRIAISGWSELITNDQGLIISHIDYWHCSRWSVLQQHLPWHTPTP